MATITTELVQLRYDLMDEASTQYTDLLLISFYNRAIRALNSFLESIGSDRVFSDTALTLASGSNYVAIPSDFSSPIAVEIYNSALTHREVKQIKKWQQENSAGTPGYYGVHNSTLIFDRAASADISIYLQYNTAAVEISAGDNMPYNDAHNDSLRGAVAMIAKNRNQLDISGDYALHEFFRAAEMGNIIRRSFKSSRNLGF